VADTDLQCRDCGQAFTFSVDEAAHFASLGYTNPPTRCLNCRRARRGETDPERRMFDAECATCGGPARVPFEPTPGRPVYCRDCFRR
jgi:CxxC-x17-CxxC domain-containing protein